MCLVTIFRDNVKSTMSPPPTLLLEFPFLSGTELLTLSYESVMRQTRGRKLIDTMRGGNTFDGKALKKSWKT